jgi:Flp pilus assembly pilin Flp
LEAAGSTATAEHAITEMRSLVTTTGRCAQEFAMDEEGAALLEYAMLVMLIALLCVVALKAIGSKVGNWYGQANNLLP